VDLRRSPVLPSGSSRGRVAHDPVSAPSVSGVTGHDAVEDERLRKLGATLLALPVYGLVYLALAARSVGRFRAVGFVGAAGLIALVLMAGSRPAPSVAVPPTPTRAVEAQLLDAVVTGHSLTSPFTLGFDAPMDAASVAGAVRLSPDAAVTLNWDADGRTLTVAPVGAWAPDTLYTITVDTSARAASGAALDTPVRAVVLTATAGKGTLAATKLVGQRVAVDTAFAIHLDRAVAVTALQAALTTKPAVAGTVTAGSEAGDYLFTPDAPLAPNTVYQVSVDGLADSDGIAFSSVPPLQVRTVAAPSVVRFRPVDGTKSVDRGAVLSVRFTTAMDHKTTAAAFVVKAAGKAVTGKVTWAETSHVLVFTPSSPLPYGAKVTMTVGSAATSTAHVAVAKAVTGTFTVAAKPVPKPVARTTASTTRTKPAPPPPSGSGGSGSASASWYSVEVYYLKLMNCTRTGGWVTSTGACSSPGGRNVAPLKLSAGISTKVSRPYAKYLAVHNLCNHFYGGTPGDRLRRAGYTSYNWGENIGCENLSPYKAVLGDHLFFQSEKSYNGGHYRNLMNSLYTEAGIGVWVYSGRVRLVIDFYRP
jgi:uncharacterized protein YkwD